jgi:hypothetical protein
MGPIIMMALTIVPLLWGARMTAWRTMNAPVRLPSLRRISTRR